MCKRAGQALTRATRAYGKIFLCTALACSEAGIGSMLCSQFARPTRIRVLLCPYRRMTSYHWVCRKSVRPDGGHAPFGTQTSAPWDAHMHCSKERKPQFVPPPLRSRHQGRQVAVWASARVVSTNEAHTLSDTAMRSRWLKIIIGPPKRLAAFQRRREFRRSTKGT